MIDDQIFDHGERLAGVHHVCAKRDQYGSADVAINLADEHPSAWVFRNHLNLRFGDIHVHIVHQLAIQRLESRSICAVCYANDRKATHDVP
jgi:hypothetical protein